MTLTNRSIDSCAICESATRSANAILGGHRSCRAKDGMGGANSTLKLTLEAALGRIIRLKCTAQCDTAILLGREHLATKSSCLTLFSEQRRLGRREWRCETCGVVNTPTGEDLNCCHVPDGSWGENCGDYYGQLACGDEGVDACKHSWTDGWLACNPAASLEKAVARPAVRSTFGAADGWSFSPLVSDAQSFLQRAFDIREWPADGSELRVGLAAVLAFGQGLPIPLCRSAAMQINPKWVADIEERSLAF